MLYILTVLVLIVLILTVLTVLTALEGKMPLVSVYIRRDDFEAWQALEKKSEAISALLNGSKEIKQVVKKQPLPEINQMFEQWEMITGIPINGQQQANRRACSNLLKKYGSEKLIQLIQGVSKAQSEEFAPRIANFCQLQAKQDTLILWGRKQAQDQTGKVIKI